MLCFHWFCTLTLLLSGLEPRLLLPAAALAPRRSRPPTLRYLPLLALFRGSVWLFCLAVLFSCSVWLFNLVFHSCQLLLVSFAQVFLLGLAPHLLLPAAAPAPRRSHTSNLCYLPLIALCLSS